MTIKCEFSMLVSQPSLSIRRRVAGKELSAIMGTGYAEIAAYLNDCKVKAAGPPFAIYYNLDWRNLDVEFGLPLSTPIDPSNHLQASQTPSGKSVSCVHIGPYDDVEPSYRALTEWLKDNGYEAAGVAYERYVDDPQITPVPELKTQIYQLIRSCDLN